MAGIRLARDLERLRQRYPPPLPARTSPIDSVRRRLKRRGHSDPRGRPEPHWPKSRSRQAFPQCRRRQINPDGRPKPPRPGSGGVPDPGHGTGVGHHLFAAPPPARLSPGVDSRFVVSAGTLPRPRRPRRPSTFHEGPPVKRPCRAAAFGERRPTFLSAARARDPATDHPGDLA